MIKLICGDAKTELKKMADESIDMVMTSPPYYGLRDYKVDGQIGLETTPAEYLQKLWAVFDEVKRVLKKEGTIWVNLGDTYGGNKIGKTDKKVSDYLKEQQVGIIKNVPGYEKCLLLIPERVAIGMVERDLDDDYELREDLTNEEREKVLTELGIGCILSNKKECKTNALQEQ